MSNFRAFIGLALLALCPLSLPAAPLGEAVSSDGQCQAVLSVSPDHPSLADAVILTLDVTCPEDEKVVFPHFGESIGELRIVDQKLTDRQLILSTMPRRSGKTPVWAMEIQCGQHNIVIPATEIDIAVQIDPQTASLDDIGFATTLIPVRSWLIYALVAVSVLIALLLIWWFYKRRKAEVPEEVPLLSPQEQALRRLADLLESGKQESDIKGFFVELTDIVRWYVERLTGLHAPELTTEEFLHRIARPAHRTWGGTESQSAYPTGSLKMLVPFLESADIVKFAKHLPTNDEIMLAFRRAEHFIQHHVELHTDTDHLSDSGTSP